MTTLATDTPRTAVVGTRSEYPVIASDIIYQGAAVGLVTATGHARPLTSDDRFVGFAERKADNSDGGAAAINVRVIYAGAIVLPVTGAVITDVGLPVYAQDDNAFSFLKTSGVFVGIARRYVSSGYMEVEFDPARIVDPHDGLTAVSVATATTLDDTYSGKVIFVTDDAGVLTLPAVEGMAFRVVNGGAFGTVLVTLNPNGSDLIKGPGISALDNKDLLNTKATANRGDYVDVGYADATGWCVTAMKGTWARE